MFKWKKQLQNFYNNKKILKKRLKDENNNPYGMIVALNKNQLGYSICNTKAGDKYDDDKAFRIAYSRAISHEDTNANFWIVRRKRLLKQKPVYYFCENKGLIFEDDFDKIIDYVYTNKFYYVYNNELAALGELKLMQDRANKYFKD